MSLTNVTLVCLCFPYVFPFFSLNDHYQSKPIFFGVVVLFLPSEFIDLSKNAVITPSESNYPLCLYLSSMKASKYASIKGCLFLLLVFILLILSAQFWNLKG